MLSKRLLEIAKLVDKNKVVYDIGSDHALLPCFLVSNNICPKAYAVDNKKGPLEKAKKTISEYHLEGKVIPILSDGLDDVKDDVEIVTIAGMGYFTVEKIFKDKDLSKYDKLIVQINKDTQLLRQYISDNHYTILDEKVIKDDFYYEIIVFSTSYHDSYSELEINNGPVLIKNNENKEYFKYKKDKLLKIYNSSHNEKLIKKIEELDSILV